MTREHTPELAVPPELAAQIIAAAEAQHRPAQDVLHDAVEDYLTRQPPPAAEAQRAAAEAAARIIQRRKGVTLGDLTIKQLINEGRP